MQVEVIIDENCRVPKVIVVANSLDDKLERLIKEIEGRGKTISAYSGNSVKLLNPSEIYRIYSSSARVYAETNDTEYTIRLRLYEVEEILDSSFVRISNTDIINLKKVKSFDLSISGTIRVYLENGHITYVSRRYVKRIKEQLGI